jgi:amino acid permease
VLSLIAATVGAGTLAFPYAIMQNGIAFGSFLIFFGALISYYSGMLLVEASVYTHKHRYDEMARILHGRRFAKLTSFCNLACLLGFAMSFIVYVRNCAIEDKEVFVGYTHVLFNLRKNPI